VHKLNLNACTEAPFGGYLKGLAILRLVSQQRDSNAEGFWESGAFVLESAMDHSDLLTFFIDRYAPTPILAPWNGGSGFYPKDNKEGIDAIASTTNERFAAYRKAIATCRNLQEVQKGKATGDDEETRRAAILRQCRNELDDRAVDWLDATVGIAADGSRSFAPVLGTGGNEGRLDYTNNFMSRIAALLISPDPKLPIRDLLDNAIFGERTAGLQTGAAGQFDPGRAGGPNQGQGVSEDSFTNPWDLVLTLEGAVAWASGLYRRQGIGYRAVLCSPFTVRANAIGYGSASSKDDARAEVWTPIWSRPVRYVELQTLLREGRASIQGRPATNALEFAEAACTLGVDRGIDYFVRYSLLKRRGDSYVALPTGKFTTGYKSEADYVRQFLAFLNTIDRRSLPKGAEDLWHNVESSIFQVLLKGGQQRLIEMTRNLGRIVRYAATRADMPRVPRAALLKADQWLAVCGFAHVLEVRIAAAVASLYGFSGHLSRADRTFAWTGADLPDRLISALSRRLQLASAAKLDFNPLSSCCALNPSDTTLFIDNAVDDELVEDLLFAFAMLNWEGFEPPRYRSSQMVLPTYAVLKHLFLAGEIRREGSEPKRLYPDLRIISLLERGDIGAATEIAINRLLVAGLRPLNVSYTGGVDSRRLAASLIIPVWSGERLAAGLFHKSELAEEATA
jgi:CRISPR-associated protein Csx17